MLFKQRFRFSKEQIKSNMSHKRTTYRNPSIIAQVASGKGSVLELEGVIAKLEKDGASHKTLKRLRRQLEERRKQPATVNTTPVAAVIFDIVPVSACAGTTFSNL